MLSIRQKAKIAWKAAFDRSAPLSAKGMLLGGILYGVLSFDLIPDLLPLLGIADDTVILLTVVMIFLKITKDIRKELAKENI